MNHMFPNLKYQIFRVGSQQNKLAKAVGIDETVLSKIIHGYRDPTSVQRKTLAKFLNADETWLFERFEVTPVQVSPELPSSSEKNQAGEDDCP